MELNTAYKKGTKTERIERKRKSCGRKRLAESYKSISLKRWIDCEVN